MNPTKDKVILVITILVTMAILFFTSFERAPKPKEDLVSPVPMESITITPDLNGKG